MPDARTAWDRIDADACQQRDERRTPDAQRPQE